MSAGAAAARAACLPTEGCFASGGAAAVVPLSVPTFAAARELLSAPLSGLLLAARRTHVALPPAYLQRKRTYIQQQLDAELLTFCPSLAGVPLAYENIRILDRLGTVDDRGYVHMDVEADFVVFQPEEGQKLLGKVDKLGASHVGCLVHGCLNASIPKPNAVPVKTWRDAGPRPGAEVEFEVEGLGACTAGVPLIRGRLLATSVHELLALGGSQNQQRQNQQKQNPLSPEEPQKKKKKKQKKQK